MDFNVISRRQMALWLGASSALALSGSLNSAYAMMDSAKAPAVDAGKLLASVSLLGDRGLGLPQAPLVMIEYGSLTCLKSAKFQAEIFPRIRADYIDSGRLRFIFREFPLDNLAMAAFVLLRCAPEDRYFTILDELFRLQPQWRNKQARVELLKIMAANGMDQPAFDACLKDADTAKSIFETGRQARADFGIKATPTIFINGRKIDGEREYPEIKLDIDQALAG